MATTKQKKRRRDSALAALFRGLGSVVDAFEAAAQTRQEQPRSSDMSGVKQPPGDCGGCK